jgi:hypothetical protein
MRIVEKQNVTIENAQDCWSLEGGGKGVMKVEMNVPVKTDISLTFLLGGVYRNGSVTDSGCEVYINNKLLRRINVENEVQWKWHGITIPAEDVERVNELKFVGINGRGGRIQYIRIWTNLLKIRPSYYWKQIYAVELSGIGKTTHSVTYDIGNTRSAIETKSFASSLGVSVTGEVSSIEASISATLSASFTETSESSHSITISKSISFTDTYEFEVPSKYNRMSAVLWQLCFGFYNDEGGEMINQRLSEGEGIIIQDVYAYNGN